MNYTFTLPLPPTKNQLHDVKNDRIYLTEIAEDWYEEAGYAILSQLKGPRKPLTGNVYVGVHYKLNRRRDLDSGEAIFDLLQKMNIIENDDQIQQMKVSKLIDKRGTPDVIVEVMKI